MRLVRASYLHIMISLYVWHIRTKCKYAKFRGEVYCDSVNIRGMLFRVFGRFCIFYMHGGGRGRLATMEGDFYLQLLDLIT